MMLGLWNSRRQTLEQSLIKNTLILVHVHVHTWYSFVEPFFSLWVYTHRSLFQDIYHMTIERNLGLMVFDKPTNHFVMLLKMDRCCWFFYYSPHKTTFIISKIANKYVLLLYVHKTWIFSIKMFSLIYYAIKG